MSYYGYHLKDNQGNVVYVGITTDTKVSKEIYQKKFGAELRLFYFAPLATVELALAWEKNSISRYRPKLNRKYHLHQPPIQ